MGALARVSMFHAKQSGEVQLSPEERSEGGNHDVQCWHTTSPTPASGSVKIAATFRRTRLDMRCWA